MFKIALILSLAYSGLASDLLAQPSNLQTQYGAPPAPSGNGYNYDTPFRSEASAIDAVEVDPLEALAANIPGGGVPGEDYPILATVPETDFSCKEQEVPGYYADIDDEAGCQVFHICQEGGVQDSFLCPNGTIFNQQYFVCDWWFNVDCSLSEEFFALNADIGKVPEDALAAETRSVDQLYAAPAEETRSVDQLYSAPNQNQGPRVAPPSQSYNSRIGGRG